MVRAIRILAITVLLVLSSLTACRQGTTQNANSGKPVAPRPTSSTWKLEDVLQLNNRGVGFIEQYNYEAGEKVFRQLVELAPDWLPGRINLAISLLNQPSEARALSESIDILRGILKLEPDNPHAHFCLGIILNHQGEPEAAEHFEAVTRIDPTDPHAWYNLGKCLEDREPGASKLSGEYFEKAAELSPALTSAVYSLAMQKRRAGEIEAGQKLLKRHRDLYEAKWEETTAVKYGLMGKYAEVIGRQEKPVSPKTGPLPLFEPVQELNLTLAEGTRWATAEDFQGDPVLELRGRMRTRFGVTSATLDYNNDGTTDVLMLGAVVRNGRIEDLLLKNEGNWKFADVTATWGLAGAHPSLGCAVGDFDNDGRPDLYITGAGSGRLMRNNGGKFSDVTATAGIATGTTVCFGAMFVDLDQDGDLDLYVTNYASLDQTGYIFTKTQPASVPNSFFRNDGKAREVAADAADEAGGAPIEIAFTAISEPKELLSGERSVAVATGDFDNDRDIDLCLAQDSGPAILILNDRLLQFHRHEIDGSLWPSGQINGVVACDFDKNGRTDLWMLGPQDRCSLLLNQTKAATSIQFKSGTTNAPAMLQGRILDLDLDGWFDMVGIASDKVLLAHNEADKMVTVPDVFGMNAQPQKTNTDLSGFIATDLDNDGPADLLAFTKTEPQAFRNLGNKHHWIKLKLTGMREAGKEMRTNRDGVAARASLHARDLWVEVENGSQTAGIGAANEPILIGLGDRKELDVVRLRWPDGTLQAEMGHATDGLITIGQEQRKPVSCPLLFTWNGERYEYIGDFLGGGGLGYLLSPGVYNVPDRDEAVKIDTGQLATNDGRFVMKIAEPMDEVTYLDHVSLVVIDHPADLIVFPNERFAPLDSRPEWKLHAYREAVLPARAVDSRGRDVTEKLRLWDRAVVDGFKLRGAWVGYAEEHAITVDFGDRLSRFGSTDPLVMYLAGWVEYPFSATNYAASTAGVSLKMPTIERLDDAGNWQPILPAAGIPAGSPKMMTLDMTGKLCGPRCVLRIRTNMQVYWDQIFVAPAEDTSSFSVSELAVIDSELGYRGHLQEHSPDGRNPTVYDYHRVDTVPLVRQAGRLTRFGDVRELLSRDDDRFVIFGAGDEISVEFDASALPSIPSGSKRSFVLRTVGYCKSADVLSAHADTVGPLPFRGMSGYPFEPTEKPADPAEQEAYQREFNTRAFDR